MSTRLGARSLVFVAALAALPRVAHAESPAPDATVADASSTPGQSYDGKRVRLNASLGGSTRALYDSYVAGAEAEVGVGIGLDWGLYGLRASFFGGTLDGGFLTLHATFGFEVDWKISRLHLGIEPRIGYFGADRETTSRQFGAYTFGVQAHVAVDLYAKNGRAFALGLAPTGDVAAALGSVNPVPAPLLGGKAYVEMRWDVR